MAHYTCSEITRNLKKFNERMSLFHSFLYDIEETDIRSLILQCCRICYDVKSLRRLDFL